jgi:hypothetical protein
VTNVIAAATALGDSVGDVPPRREPEQLRGPPGGSRHGGRGGDVRSRPWTRRWPRSPMARSVRQGGCPGVRAPHPPRDARHPRAKSD